MHIDHIFMFLGILGTLEGFMFYSRKLAVSAMEVDPMVKGIPELPKDIAGLLRQDNRRRVAENSRAECWKFRLFQLIALLFFIYFSGTEEGDDLSIAFLIGCASTLIAAFSVNHCISFYDRALKKIKGCSNLFMIEFDFYLKLLKKARLKRKMTRQEVEASLAGFKQWKKISNATQQKIVSLANALREMEITQEYAEDTLEWGFAKDFVILKIIGWEVVNEAQIAANKKVGLEARQWERMTSYSYIFYKLNLIEGSRGKIEADCRSN